VDDMRGALGQRVRELREELGYSQEELAERADLHVTYISGIERGQRNPGLNILASLAKALRVSLPALVTDLKPHMRIKTRRRGRPPRRIRSAG
jgi:transcriptional regulator with XRE-family HTH domain